MELGGNGEILVFSGRDLTFGGRDSKVLTEQEEQGVDV
jgi:hypothetical protein